jgi:hypothetical protein
MTRLLLIFFVIFLVNSDKAFPASMTTDNANNIGKRVKAYFEEQFSHLRTVVNQGPTVNNFRQLMTPIAKITKGFYGATLIDPNFVIREVYYPTHFLARGYDLKKVKELKKFYKMMKDNPSPQLSEPAGGSILQPRLIAMRYPIIKNGKLKGILSMMVRTSAFLKATGLDKMKAFRIICSGKLTEKRGKLPQDYKEVKLKLPSTEWIIQYYR